MGNRRKTCLQLCGVCLCFWRRRGVGCGGLYLQGTEDCCLHGPKYAIEEGEPVEKLRGERRLALDAFTYLLSLLPQLPNNR